MAGALQLGERERCERLSESITVKRGELWTALAAWRDDLTDMMCRAELPVADVPAIWH
jgi:hypothetical protein